MKFQFPSNIETSNNNKINVTSRSGQYEKNLTKHQFKTVHLFPLSINAFKTRNNRISNQNLSEKAQTPARFFENNTLAYSVKAVPGYMRKVDTKLVNIAATHQQM